MTDPEMDERLLRLNAALDGELDAMAQLAFEREMRDDPALAAEYRRLAALARRDPPPRAARSRSAGARRPHRGARPVRSAGARAWPPRLRPRPSFRSGAAHGSTAARWRWPPRSPSSALPSARGSCRCARPRSGGVAQNLVSDFARARSPASPSTSPRPTATRSSPGSPAGRRSAPISSISRRRASRLRAGGSSSSTGFPAPTLVYRHNEHLVAVTELPLKAQGRARRGRGRRNDRRLPRRALDGREPRLHRRVRHGRKDARRIRRGVPARERRRDRARPSLSLRQAGGQSRASRVRRKRRWRMRASAAQILDKTRNLRHIFFYCRNELWRRAAGRGRQDQRLGPFALQPKTRVGRAGNFFYLFRRNPLISPDSGK